MEINKEPVSRGEKKRELFQHQKELLDTFLEHGAISQAQYDKSLGDLRVKMGIGETSFGNNINEETRKNAKMATAKPAEPYGSTAEGQKSVNVFDQM